MFAGCFEMFLGLLNSATKSVQRLKTQEMKQYGLNGAHLTCLYRLVSVGEEGLTQVELVQKEMTDASQISRIMRELIDGDYARLEGEERKYRRRYILTASGRNVAEKIREDTRGIVDDVSAGISEEDFDAFYRTFARICERLAAIEIPDAAD